MVAPPRQDAVQYSSPSEVAAQHSAIEPAPKLRFVHAFSRQEHTLKHPILGRAERWHQMLDAQVLSDARDEFANGRTYGEACKSVAAAYEAILAEALHATCVAETGHGHVLEYELELTNGPTVVPLWQTVYGWITEKKLIIVAKLNVRKQSSGAYTLRSGYRGAPKQSRSQFEAQRRARLEDRTLLERRAVLIALHDKAIDS